MTQVNFHRENSENCVWLIYLNLYHNTFYMLGDRDRAVNKRHPFPIFKEVIKYAIERGHHKKCGEYYIIRSHKIITSPFLRIKECFSWGCLPCSLSVPSRWRSGWLRVESYKYSLNKWMTKIKLLLCVRQHSRF